MIGTVQMDNTGTEDMGRKLISVLATGSILLAGAAGLQSAFSQESKAQPEICRLILHCRGDGHGRDDRSAGPPDPAAAAGRELATAGVGPTTWTVQPGITWWRSSQRRPFEIATLMGPAGAVSGQCQ